MKIPEIPSLSSGVATEVRRAFDSLRVFMKELRGRGGAVGVTDLVDAGLFDSSGNSNLPTTVTDSALPSKLTNFAAAGAFRTIILDWDQVLDKNFAYVEIWRNTEDVLGTAVRVGTTSAMLYSDAPPQASLSVAYYYWGRAINGRGQAGPWNDTAGTLASTANDPSYVLEVLKDQITSSQLHATLTAKINQIDVLQENFTALAGEMVGTVFVQEAEPVPGVDGVPDPIPENSRWYDSDDNNKPNLYVDGAWIDISDPRVGQMQTDLVALDAIVKDASTGLAKTRADLIAEQTTRANADTALAGQYTALSAQVNNATTGLPAAHAAVSAESIARANGDSALALSIETLQASTDGNAIIFEELFNTPGGHGNWQNWSGGGERAIITDATVAGGKYLRVGLNNGSDGAWLNNLTRIPLRSDSIYKITVVARRVAGVGAFYAGFTGIDADMTRAVGTSNAPSASHVVGSFYCAAAGYALPAEWETRIGYARALDGPGWPAEAAGYGQNTFPSLVKYITPLAIVNYSNTTGQTDIASIKVEIVGTKTSALMEIKSTVEAASAGRAAAQYTIKTDVNGKISGIGLANDGATSSVEIVADKFAICESDGTGTKIPFIVYDGVVYMDTAMIRDLTSTNIRAAGIAADRLSVANLAAVSANMGAITAGTVTMSNTASWIKSSNYALGSAGILIRGDGYAEFQNILARGNIEATSLETGTAMVDTANIKTAAVETLSIGPDQVFLPMYVTCSSTAIYADSTGSPTSSSLTIATAPSIDAMGGKVLIFCDFGMKTDDATYNYLSWEDSTIELRRNGSVFFSTKLNVQRFVLDSPGSGNTTYSVVLKLVPTAPNRGYVYATSCDSNGISNPSASITIFAAKR